ncbi:MAG TPA: hypothetical protein HPP72_09705 [Gammaproteobacteria bacterium]|jgi:hypothetical protein|nr:hypothetical protein [Gammaproteobacteria bacterium]
MSNKFNSANYPTTAASRIIAGDRTAWKITELSADYPTDEYTLKYAARLESDGSTEIEITATGSGDNYLIELESATTAAYSAGTYQWQLYIIRDSDSERITITNGSFEVIANRDTNSADPRSQNKIALDAINAVMSGRASKDQESYSIDGRSLSRTPISDLILLQKHYKNAVAREQNAERIRKGLPSNRVIFTRFG